MKQLIQFIIDNKEWIFSGIGVAIVSAFIRIFLGRKARQQNIKAGDSSTNIQTGDGSTITVASISQTRDSHIHKPKPIKIADRGGVIHLTRINEGDYQEFLWGVSTVRVAITEIKKEKFYLSRLGGEKELHGAVIDVSTGGGLVCGGTDCKKTGVNQYLVPQKKFDDEEPCSVYAYHVRKDYFNFLRIVIDHINPHSRQVTLNLFFADIRDIKSS